jgi:hypothetical protein
MLQRFLMATTELNNGSAQWAELRSIQKGGISMSATASAVTCTSYSVWDIQVALKLHYLTRHERIPWQRDEQLLDMYELRIHHPLQPQTALLWIGGPIHQRHVGWALVVSYWF